MSTRTEASVNPSAVDVTPVRLIILGGGAVVRHCFAPALDKLGLTEHATIVDPRSNGAGFGSSVRVVTKDFREVLEADQLGGATHCVVALPNALHYAAVTRAIKAGLHVLCEKPLALSSQECEQLAGLAQAHGRILAVNMVRRLFHSVRIAMSVLERGWLGTITSVRVAHGDAYGWPISSPAAFEPRNGGVLADMGVHYLDMFESMLGQKLIPISYVDDHAGGVESESEYSLQTDTGVAITIQLSRLRLLDNEIRISGSAGQLTIGVDRFDRCIFEPAVHTDSASDALVLSSDDERSSGFSDYFAEQLQRFIAARPDADHALVDGRTAARAAALVEWAYARRTPKRSPLPADRVRLERGRLFVTGATGFIGSHLIDRLAQDNSGELTAAYRTIGSCAAISRYPVQYHATNLLRHDDVRAAVRGHRYVFHLAVSRDPKTERQITVDGTKHVVEACIEEGVESIVVLSTMYVLGHPDGTVDETSPYNPISGAYATSKAEMERWCLERAKTSGTRIIVLLPTCVYGPRGQIYTEVPVRFARAGRFCWIADGSGIANVVYVENLVDAMIRAAVMPEAHGQRFIVNDASLSWRSFLSPLLGPWADQVPSPTADQFRALIVAPRPSGVRDVAASILRSPEVWDTVVRTRVANQLRPLIKKYAPSVSRLRRGAVSKRQRAAEPTPPPVSWLPEVYGPTTTRFSSEKARKILGWAPSVGRDTAVARTVAWLEREGLFEADLGSRP